MTCRAVLGGLAVLASWGVSGCRCSSHDSRARHDAKVSASASPVPDLSPGPPRHASPLARDPLWRRAEAGDDIDLARLAQREGARGLLQGVQAGGTLALTALRALPRANDAQLALRRLCEILRSSDPEKLEPVVRAVQAIISKPPRGVEQLDPEGMRSCDRPLAELSANPKLPPEERDLATSARAMLAEHGIKP